MSTEANEATADAIRDVLTAEGTGERYGEIVCACDALNGMSDGLQTIGRRIANAIAADAAPGRDETGGHVESLTEAVMGTTAGLCRIAEAIEHLAEAVEHVGCQKQS